VGSEGGGEGREAGRIVIFIVYYPIPISITTYIIEKEGRRKRANEPTSNPSISTLPNGLDDGGVSYLLFKTVSRGEEANVFILRRVQEALRHMR